jgi:hypothetical protein
MLWAFSSDCVIKSYDKSVLLSIFFLVVRSWERSKRVYIMKRERKDRKKERKRRLCRQCVSLLFPHKREQHETVRIVKIYIYIACLCVYTSGEGWPLIGSLYEWATFCLFYIALVDDQYEFCPLKSVYIKRLNDNNKYDIIVLLSFLLFTKLFNNIFLLIIICILSLVCDSLSYYECGLHMPWFYSHINEKKINKYITLFFFNISMTMHSFLRMMKSIW